MTIKSCDLKGNQKVFRLHLNQAASCCVSYSETLDDTKTLDHYINHWQQEKIQLDQGQEIASCEVCWKNENSGLESYRQQLRGNAYAGKPGEPPQSDRFCNSIEIFISNLCNQMCSYCSPKFSSEWENSVADNGIFAKVSTTAKNNQILENSSATNQEYWLIEIEKYISKIVIFHNLIYVFYLLILIGGSDELAKSGVWACGGHRSRGQSR